MNLEEFFVELKKVKSSYIWKIDNDAFGVIRGFNAESGRFCPITAVAKRWFPVSAFDTASRSIGLSHTDCMKIWRAADNQCENEEEKEIRGRLLTILDLT